MSDQVHLYEVSPRDGLQNEAGFVPTDNKLAFIERLLASGCRDIEVTSFVRPRWIPQLADAADLVRRLPNVDGVTYWALVPNQVGLERALGAGIPAIATFLSASETHNKKNINRTIRESLAAQQKVIAAARAEGMKVRSYISTVFGCPYEGDVDPGRVADLAGALLAAGVDQLSLGDTTGMGNPLQVTRVLERLDAEGVPLHQLALHMHDTRGTALANVYAGWRAGIRTFDASTGGLGGCPYAPGASGNLASEDLIYMFEAMGVQTGVDLDALAEAGHYVEEALGRELPGRYHLYHRGSRQRVVQTA